MRTSADGSALRGRWWQQPGLPGVLTDRPGMASCCACATDAVTLAAVSTASRWLTAWTPPAGTPKPAQQHASTPRAHPGVSHMSTTSQGEGVSCCATVRRHCQLCLACSAALEGDRVPCMVLCLAPAPDA